MYIFYDTEESLCRKQRCKSIMTVVSAVLSEAKRNEIIQKNPARMIDLPEARKRMQAIPTGAEARRFLEALVPKI